MIPIRIRRIAVLGLTATLLAVCSSCFEPSMNPGGDQARAAVEAALNAWRAGEKPGLIPGTDPPVQAVDNDWTNGRELAAYEIVRELPSEFDKRFVVRLTYAAPAADVETVYIVLGASPIAVFREDDYNRTLNMDNNPTTKRKR